jgi:pyruvate dehydrogenase E2 component (dihydrolipoamide acetyltransferase)
VAVFEFRLPDIGEGIHEGEIVRWIVKPGDEVKEDDPIVEVQNDKAVVEIPSPVHGKVLEIKVPEGQVAVVGDVLVTFAVDGESVASGGMEKPPVGADVTPDGSRPMDSAVGGKIAANVAAARVDTPLASKKTKETETDATGREPVPQSSVNVLATPGVRKFARERGVDIARVKGTGPHGKVTREDVERFLQGGGSETAVETVPAETRTEPAAPAEGRAAHEAPEERVPLRGVRKAIAAAMVKSVYTAPHVTIMDEADVSDLVALRNRLKPVAEQRGVKLTYLPFIVKALVAVVKQYPVLNASVDDETNEIVYKKYYHVGIATDTDHGLLVPVVRDADRKNLWTIATEIQDLATRARQGKLGPNEMKGSTVSITNIGSAGGLFFTPVIHYPEVAILGTGRITEKAVVKQGAVVPAPVMALSLSFDHRIIDGATAQHGMNRLKQLLEDPQFLMMEV